MTTAFDLHVSDELYEWIRTHRGHPNARFNPTCYYSCFLKVADLINVHGNTLVDAKYEAVLQRVMDEPLALQEDNMPFVTLDCVTGAMRLVDGNHRLAAFHALGYVWFPVVVAVVSTPGGEPVRHIPKRYQGDNNYDNARLWRGSEAAILQDVFHLIQL